MKSKVHKLISGIFLWTKSKELFIFVIIDKKEVCLIVSKWHVIVHVVDVCGFLCLSLSGFLGGIFDDVSRSSNRASSSVPSIELLIPHFLNAFTTMSGFSESQASRTHWTTSGRLGFLMLPVGVYSLVPLIIHWVQYSLILALKGLFRLTSSGCSNDVQPPGITA